MLAGYHCHSWQAACLNRLLAVERSEAVLWIRLIDEAAPRLGGSLFAKLNPARLIGWKILRKLEKMFWPAPEFDSVDVPSGVRRLPELRGTLRKKGEYALYFDRDDIDTIKRYELDFIMAFLGYRIIHGDILEAARYGVWAYHFADEAKFRGSPPGAWEIYEDEPETGAVLQRLTSRLDAGIILKKKRFPTNKRSVRLNHANLVIGALAWPAEVCKDILDGRASYACGAPSETTAPIYKWPGNGEALRLTLVLLRNNLAHLVATMLRRPRP